MLEVLIVFLTKTFFNSHITHLTPMKQLVSFAGYWKSARFALAFALLFAVGTFGFYACSNKTQNEVAPKEESISIRNKNGSAMSNSDVYQQQTHINNCQRVLGLGILDLSVNNNFSQIVHNLTEARYNGSTEEDYYVTFAEINQAYANIGRNLLSEMTTSLTNHGGTTNDVTVLSNNLFSITLNTGTVIETGLRLSYKDGIGITNNTHLVTTEQLYGVDNIPTWELQNGTFSYSTKSVEYVNASHTWNIELSISDATPNHPLYKMRMVSYLEAHNGDVDFRRECRWNRLHTRCYKWGSSRKCSC